MELNTKRLNDQIVFMRKEVKRAIVHQIHRHTTAAKRLRSKKGTDEQIQKNAIKADNMVAEISILKKLKPDDVSVFGLTNFEEIEIKNFICKRVIAPETKAMAKLCLRKNLRSVIDQFIREIGSTNNRLLELLDERQQHKEKKENKKQKKHGKKEESNSAYDHTSDSTLDSSDESVLDLLPAKRDSDTEKLHFFINNKIDDAVDSIVDVDDNLDISDKVKSKPARVKKNSPVSSDSSRENSIIEQVETINNEYKSDNQNANLEIKHTEISSTRIENKPLERKNIDPFFMTRDNSEYRTYCNIAANAKKEKDESDESKTNDGNKNNKNDFNKGTFDKKNYTKGDSFNKNKYNQRFDSKKTITYLGGNDRKSFDKKGFRKADKRPLSEDSSSTVKLHPSWEAKKKLSVSTVPFQGKKITFDE